MPPLPADFIHARACKLKCEKILTRPMPNVDLPGFGLVLAVIVMGAFLMFQIIRKKESD